MDENRIIEIETKLAYQEHMIAELNSVVIDQQATLDELIKNTQALARRIMELTESLAPTDRGPEKPPHY